MKTYVLCEAIVVNAAKPPSKDLLRDKRATKTKPPVLGGKDFAVV